MTHPIDLLVTFPCAAPAVVPYHSVLCHQARQGRSEAVELEFDYVSALICELDRKARHPLWNRRQVRSIIFQCGGGGLISPESVTRVLEAVKGRLQCTRDTRVAVQSVPECVRVQRLEQLGRVGVNRLVLRSWSFVAETLRLLGCRHTNEQSISALVASRVAGIREIGVDLTFAVPGQSPSEFRRELEIINEYQPDHVSAHPYADKPSRVNSPAFLGDMRTGRRPHPLRMRMKKVLDGTLEFGGYEAQQINDFVRPGKACGFSIVDWLWRDFMGLGAGAVTRVTDEGNRRLEFTTSADVDRYVDHSLLSERTLARGREVPLEQFIFEFIAAQFSQAGRIDCGRLEHWLQIKFDDLYPGLVEILIRSGYLVQHGAVLELTEPGLGAADNIIDGFRLSERALREAAQQQPLSVYETLERAGIDDFVPALAA